jgi:SAM-dependent methyltransferase
MSEFESLRQSFNEVADLYDQVRPGYPEVVVDDISSYAGMSPGSCVLEIGCGTGQITLPLAIRGYTILALEPGEALAALAIKKCAPYPNVTVVPMTFEQWPAPGQQLDLVIAAQSFHWIEPYSGCEKAATILRPGGTIALVWNNDVSEETPFYKATQSLYDRYMPKADAQDHTRAHIHNALRQTRAFGEVRESRYPWERTYSSSEYRNLLNTYSDHQRLPEPLKTEFFEAIEEVISRMGGTVTRNFETQTLLARRI